MIEHSKRERRDHNGSRGVGETRGEAEGREAKAPQQPERLDAQERNQAQRDPAVELHALDGIGEEEGSDKDKVRVAHVAFLHRSVFVRVSVRLRDVYTCAWGGHADCHLCKSACMWELASNHRRRRAAEDAEGWEEHERQQCRHRHLPRFHEAINW